MNSLVVAGFVLIVLLLSVMLGKKNKLAADKFLILYLTVAALGQIYRFIEQSGALQESYWMLLGKGFYLLHAPFLFLYVYALTRQRVLHPVSCALVFLPFVIYVLHFFYYYFLRFDNITISIQHGLIYTDGNLSISWLVFAVLFLAVDPVFLFLSYYFLRRYRARLLDSVSNTERINLHWVYVLLSLWLFSSLILIPLGILTVGKPWFSLDVFSLLVEISNVLFFFIAGFYGFKQTTVFTNLGLRDEPQSKTVSAYERSGLSAADASNHHSHLLRLMEEKKPFLNGELTATDLSRLLGISVNHLSQVLNKEQKQNFFDFVNSYRVKEVIRKMEDPANSHLTLLAMALDSGFNSKTSFNTIFKKTTHQTPSQYYKSLKR